MSEIHNIPEEELEFSDIGRDGPNLMVPIIFFSVFIAAIIFVFALIEIVGFFMRGGV